MQYLCSMFKRLLCLTFTFAIVLMSWAEDLRAVMSYYKPDMTHGFIFVSKADMTLTLVNPQGKAEVTYPIACGRVRGQKKSRGDNRTPEGHFLLQQIQDATTWGHDFRDGKGYIKHAYGPWFMRLQTGFAGIGIHGTHAPQSIGTRATEGCIRLANANVDALRQRVTIGMPVIIGPEEGVQMLIAHNIPSPSQPGAKGLTGVASSATLAAAKPATPKTPAKATSAATASASSASKPATGKVVASTSERPASSAAVTKAASTPVVAETKVTEPVVVATKAETVKAVTERDPAITAVKAEDSQASSVAKAEDVSATAEPAQVSTAVTAAETVQEEKVVTSAAEPQYEVVVEEVQGPDGEVKYEVRYKLVQ